MKKFQLIAAIILLFFIPVLVPAQQPQIILVGTVYFGDFDNETVPLAGVVVYDQNNAQIAFTQTDLNGVFSVGVGGPSRPDRIEISVLGYSKTVFYNGNPDLGNIYLDPEL